MDKHLETLCVQAGYSPKNGEPRILPIYQSTTFKYESSEEMGQLFDLEASGYFYSRLQNPTNDYVAAKIAQLEGGTAAMLTGSGLRLNDPYALKGIHIPTDEETAKNAKQAADDTISALVRQAKEK